MFELWHYVIQSTETISQGFMDLKICNLIFLYAKTLNLKT